MVMVPRLSRATSVPVNTASTLGAAEAGRGRVLREILGRRSHRGDALDGKDLADLVHAQLGLALGHRLGGVAAGPEHRLVLDRLRDPETLQHAREVDAAGAAARRV